MALKDLHGGKPWFEWEDKFKYHDHSAIGEFMNEYSRELGYYICEQYLFEQQWQMRKEQINQMNIGIIGDMPIYVSYDSVDVWANPQYFDLDENYKPKKVAGVPPDYFCAEIGYFCGFPLIIPTHLRQEGPHEDFHRQLTGNGPVGERPSPPAVPKPAAPLSGGVSQTGWLQVKGTQLCGESGEPVVLIFTAS